MQLMCFLITGATSCTIYLAIPTDQPEEYAVEGSASRKQYLTEGFHRQSVQRAKEFIELHFHEQLRLKQIASHAYQSMFHFSRVFKQHAGISPYQYLLHVRIN